MHRRFLLALLVAFAFVPTPKAMAQSLDQSAAQKIDQAINEHYLATDFKKAEAVLLDVVKACGNQCSPQVLAKTWMYIGLIRGSGREDQAGAREAFGRALTVDRNVRLDDALATPDTKASFQAAATAGAGTQAPAAAAPGAGPGFSCTPNVPEVETRRPIPVSCASPPNAVQVELYYRLQGVEKYNNLPMQLAGAQYSTVIPCLATSATGQLEFYVVAKDLAGLPVAEWGAADRPQVIRLVEQTTAAPPSLPGQPPPQRCKSDAECPPGLPGCVAEGGGWGDSCSADARCKQGLWCKGGICEPAPPCKADSECPTGVCSEGYCQAEESPEEDEGDGAFKKNWIGLHLAVDVGIIKGDRLCALQGWDQNFRCYNDQNQLLMAPAYESGPTSDNPDPYPYWSTSVGTTPVLASLRVLLSYDRAVMPNLTVGGRLGLAFGGAPDFFPYHIEARAAYWILPLSRPGIKAYVGVGGGMAEVDAKIDALLVKTRADLGSPEPYSAYKRMGQGFVALSLGGVYPLGPKVGVQANINGMYMLPSTGLVIEPSVGGIVGF